MDAHLLSSLRPILVGLYKDIAELHAFRMATSDLIQDLIERGLVNSEGLQALGTFAKQQGAYYRDALTEAAKVFPEVLDVAVRDCELELSKIARMDQSRNP